MCRLIHEAMDAGACGWSAQVLGAKSIQRDYDGTPMITDLLSEHEILTFAKILADRDEGFIELAYQETGEEGRPLAEETKRFFEEGRRGGEAADPIPGRRPEFGAPRTAPRTDTLVGKLCRAGVTRLWPGCHAARRVRDDFEDWNLFDDTEAWREVTLGTKAERKAKMQDPRDASPPQRGMGLLRDPADHGGSGFGRQPDRANQEHENRYRRRNRRFRHCRARWRLAARPNS